MTEPTVLLVHRTLSGWLHRDHRQGAPMWTRELTQAAQFPDIPTAQAAARHAAGDDPAVGLIAMTRIDPDP